MSDDSPENIGPARIILTVADPDALSAQAFAAGASVVFPVGEEHGWHVGCVVNPFGHHWKIGREIGRKIA